MAKDQLKDLHLFAMESALPFGMGIINNAKTGGLQKIMDVFKSQDPVSEFQIDGETSAQAVRDKIDQLIPGLGHPVISVDVTVEEKDPDYEINDQDPLVSTLKRIDDNLNQLRCYIGNDSSTTDDK